MSAKAPEEIAPFVSVNEDGFHQSVTGELGLADGLALSDALSLALSDADSDTLSDAD